MTRRPIIGLTGEHLSAALVGSALPVQHGFDGDWYYADYARAVREAGGLPVYVPTDSRPSDYVEALDGLLLAGGGDIDPTRYGAVRAQETQEPDPIRDEFELELAQMAIAKRLPTLGICRGVQLINVVLGGTIVQHVPSHAFVDGRPDDLTHDVELAAGSTLQQLFGDSLSVNSLHHQAVENVGADLHITATSPDGGIEGLEHVSAPVVAVQWHPEMLPTRSTDPLFSWLVEAAS